MSGVESPVQETQKVLLERQLLQALGRLEGRRPRLLAFDSGVGGGFRQAGHDVSIVHPCGPWPEGEESFDLILGIGLLEKTDDDRKSVYELRDLLADDGIFVLAPPLAASGRPPPNAGLRQYSIDELGSLVHRSGLMATALWADGPELIICECRRSTESGAEMVATVADFVGRSRWDEAEAALSAATEQMENEELVREYAMLIGHVHLSRGRLAEALEAFNDATNLASPSALTYTGMGAVAMSANDIEAAKELFEAALDLCPTHFPAMRGMGMIHEALGDTEAALTSFDMAATQRPSERDVAEKVVNLSIAVCRADPATHAIKRYVTVTGDERWAKKLLDRIAPIKAQERSKKSPAPVMGSAES